MVPDEQGAWGLLMTINAIKKYILDSVFSTSDEKITILTTASIMIMTWFMATDLKRHSMDLDQDLCRLWGC